MGSSERTLYAQRVKAHRLTMRPRRILTNVVSDAFTLAS
jgi:hypothetical protein